MYFKVADTAYFLLSDCSPGVHCNDSTPLQQGDVFGRDTQTKRFGVLVSPRAFIGTYSSTGSCAFALAWLPVEPASRGIAAAGENSRDRCEACQHHRFCCVALFYLSILPSIHTCEINLQLHSRALSSMQPCC